MRLQVRRYSLGRTQFAEHMVPDPVSDTTFRVGAVFPAARKQTAVLRLLVATRQLVAFLKSLSELQPRETPEHRERFHFLLLATIASAKEDADAFRDADAQGCFAWLDKAAMPSTDELRAAVAGARKGAARDESASLYNRVLKHVRDSTGFHWNRVLIGEALAHLQDRYYRTFEEMTNGSVASVPLVLDLVGVAAWGRRIKVEEIPSTLDEVRAFQRDLIAVAHDQYIALVRAFASSAAPQAPAVGGRGD